MQGSCKQNIDDSFQILRLINFVQVVHQISGVLYTPHPTTTKHGESSSSTLVMSKSDNLLKELGTAWPSG